MFLEETTLPRKLCFPCFVVAPGCTLLPEDAFFKDLFGSRWRSPPWPSWARRITLSDGADCLYCTSPPCSSTLGSSVSQLLFPAGLDHAACSRDGAPTVSGRGEWLNLVGRAPRTATYVGVQLLACRGLGHGIPRHGITACHAQLRCHGRGHVF